MSKRVITIEVDGNAIADGVLESLRDMGAQVKVCDDMGQLVEDAQRSLLESVADTNGADTALKCAEAFERITNAWTRHLTFERQWERPVVPR